MTEGNSEGSYSFKSYVDDIFLERERLRTSLRTLFRKTRNKVNKLTLVIGPSTFACAQSMAALARLNYKRNHTITKK